MSLPKSVLEDALTIRGFDRWVDEGYPRTILESLPLDSAPVFFRITFFELTMTFVLDEYYVFWAAAGAVDLSDLDLVELEYSTDEPARFMH